MEPDSKNIRVVVRIRPENERETSSQNHRIVVQPVDESVLVFDPKEEAPTHFFHGKPVWKRDITKRKNRDLKFGFDYVFSSHSTNKDVFEETTKSILDGVLDGYNSSVFAYGATGAGKTHTMLGKPCDPGVTFLTVMELYSRINAMKSEKTIEVAVSYLEVYNEQIRDLLLPNGTLPIREDSRQGVVVQGLSLHKPRNAEELMHMLAVGNENRTQHPTDANSESSRSHAVFQVFVRQRDRTANITANVKMAKLSLIDLAGSERATVTRNMGTRFREGANINRSLLALGNVINALADNKVKNMHVPYRNSKLTRLLKDSLGGNCQTVMISAVSPSSLSYEDTYNTLKYADRAKSIKAELKKNVLNVDIHVSRYAQIVEELRKEIVELKEKLRATSQKKTIPNQLAVPCVRTKSFKERLCQIFQSRVNIRKELLEFESSEREIQWKIVCKDRKLFRLSLINSPDGSSLPIVQKIQKSVETSRKRLSVLTGRKECVMSRMVENSESLKEIESEISSESGEIPEVLQETLSRHHLEVEVMDYRRCNKYLRTMIKSQDREAQLNDRLIGGLLQMVRKQFFLLKGHGLITSDLSEDFHGLQGLIDGAQEVKWADQSSASQNRDKLLNFPVLTSYTTPPTPRSKHLHSPIPSPMDKRTCSSVARYAPVLRVTDTNVEQLSSVDGAETDISPPVTKYAGQTPFAKQFVQTHTKENENTRSPCVKSASQDIKAATAHDLDVTYLCSGPSVVVSTGTSIHSALTNQQEAQTRNIDPSTVTKAGIKQGTVTKSKPSVGLEHISGSQVARAMVFDNVTPPTPKSEMSFADAVKSPARTPLRQITHNCMSPLALPLNSPKPDVKKRLASTDIENVSRPAIQTKSTLQRMGLPSVISPAPGMKHQARRVVPHYMQTTKSVANRRMGSYRVKGFGDENRMSARRERVETSAHRPLHFRSKSVPNLKC